MAYTEYTIIDRIAHQFPRKTQDYLGIGDDAAALFNPPSPLLITQDLLVEDVHFRLSYFSPEALAHKALHANLSDIAAMGGRSQYMLLSLSIPDSISSDWLNRFSDHLTHLCQLHQVTIIGGDTTKSPDKLYISITLLGTSDHPIKLRSGAKPGDIICVTGNLGDAYAGLLALEKNLPGREYFKNKQLFPEARIQESIYFGKIEGITAMMDISDGLYIDLQNLCKSSSVGAEINMEAIPHSAEIEIETAIQGGEDYELLLTVEPNALEKLQPYSIYPIGYTTENSSINYNYKNKKIDPKITPYLHFKR